MCLAADYSYDTECHANGRTLGAEAGIFFNAGFLTTRVEGGLNLLKRFTAP